jgi:type VI secretion system secreted protein VgrG
VDRWGEESRRNVCGSGENWCNRHRRARQGKVQVQAQHGEMEWTSEKNQDITSTTRKIRFNAKQEVLLTSGGAYVRIKDGSIFLHCPGTLSVKGAQHVFSGPDSMNPPMPQFPLSKLDTPGRHYFSM